MYVERHPFRRRNRIHLPNCGCMLVLGIIVPLVVMGAVLVAPNVIAFVERLQSGEVTINDLFSGVQATQEAGNSAVPTINPTDRATSLIPDELEVGLGDLGTAVLQNPSDDFEFMQLGSGRNRYVRVTITETGILAMCNRFIDTCDDETGGIRNIEIDLHTGEPSILRLEVNIQDESWQPIEILLYTDGSNRIYVDGFIYGGIQFDAPPGQLGELFANLEATVGSILRGTTVTVDGIQYQLDEIYNDDENIVVILR